MVQCTYIVCGSLYILCMLQMPRKRAIGRLGPKSDEIINRNSCFEAVFDSVLKSDFFSSAPRGAVTRFDILMYTYRCIHTAVYIQMYTYRGMHTGAYIQVYTYRCIHTDVYVQMYTYIGIHTGV